MECAEPGCTKPLFARGICSAHYDWHRRRGSLPPTRYRIRPPQERFWEKLDKNGPNGCWLWLSTRDPNGYGRFGLSKAGADRSRYAHRLAWQWHNGCEVPTGMSVCHSCDNPPCCNPAHLFLGTQADNLRDMSMKGRHHLQVAPALIAGGRNPSARLDETSVREIRAMRSRGATYLEIANLFGIGETTVANVVRRRSWKAVD